MSREFTLCSMVFYLRGEEMFRLGQPDAVCEHIDNFEKYEDLGFLGAPLVTSRKFRDEYGFGVGSSVSEVLAKKIGDGSWHVYAAVDPDGYQAGFLCNQNGNGRWAVNYAFSFVNRRPLEVEAGGSYAAKIDISDIGSETVVAMRMIPFCGN